MSRLTTKAVELIHARLSQGASRQQVARETGWSSTTIWEVVHGKRTGAPPRPSRRCGLRGCHNEPVGRLSSFCCVSHARQQQAIEKRRRK